MAKNDFHTYDTAAIRGEARKILNCCNHVENSALPRVQGARSKLDGEFVGCAADALDESLDQSQKQLKKLNEDLSGLYTALMRYADALEEADRRIAQLLS